MSLSPSSPAQTLLADNVLTTLPTWDLFRRPDGAPGSQAAWQFAATPFPVPPAMADTLSQFGRHLWQFTKALNQLYLNSLQGKAPAWVASLLNQGKPLGLLQFAQMKRHRQDLPLVLRPDLLLGDDGQLTMCELDAVPGGLGFTSALNHHYRQAGFPVLEPPEGLPQAWLNTLQKAHTLRHPLAAPDAPPPFVAVCVSDESADYLPEWRWLITEALADAPHVALIHPRDVYLMRNRLCIDHPATGQPQPVDVLYRFFELFDLPNIPNAELIQFAAKKQWLTLTPSLRPHLEEKLMLALLHHPALTSHWGSLMGQDATTWLRTHTPQTWILDPTPLPPGAVLPGLTRHGPTSPGDALQSFADLADLGQKARHLVIKPSGFSPLAWGSRGVTIGHDVPQDVWQTRLTDALSQFGTTPHLLQPFAKPTVVPWSRLNPNTLQPEPFEARLRLCPYYLVDPTTDTPHLASLLVTGCPKDKKIIHGMSQAIMAPAMLV